MLDHVGINVSDYERSRDFYATALAPIGHSLLMEPVPRTGGFGGSDGKPEFWITDLREPVTTNVHIAFSVADHETVDAFHAAGLEAGGTDNGAPGIREIYHPQYYGAFVLDPTATTSRPSATARPRCSSGASRRSPATGRPWPGRSDARA
jgi:catechol 2,3-dioxygenase-like lactoylglutathione lyase family enzyme